jgi:hypothetical protein
MTTTVIAHVALGQISARASTGGGVSMMEGVPIASARLTALSPVVQKPSQFVATAFAADGPNQFWRITAHYISSVIVRISDEPLGPIDDENEWSGCWYVPAGTSIELSAKAGQRVYIGAPF